MSDIDPSRVSIIIVTYNALTESRACLDSLRGTGIPMHVHVVDNNSGDEMRAMLREYASQWVALRLHLLEDNIGLAAGNNIPIEQLDTEYTMILNPDTEMNAEAFNSMLRYLDEHEEVGVVGPRQLYEDGLQHSSFHSGWNLFHILIWTLIPRGLLAYWYDKRASRFRTKEVGFVSGSCLLTRTRHYQEVGGYDKRLFLAVEDVADLCRRIRALGCKVMFLNEATITHLGARSSVRFFAYMKSCDGRIYYAGKWYGVLAEKLVFGIVWFNSVLKAGIYGVFGLVKRSLWDAADVHVNILKWLSKRES